MTNSRMNSRIEYLDVLLADPNDYFAEVNGEVFLFIMDGAGDYSIVHSEPCTYKWNEEMIGDVDGLDVDAFEAELNYLAPEIFERKEAVSPSANQTKFLQDGVIKSSIEKIWNEALEAICNA